MIYQRVSELSVGTVLQQAKGNQQFCSVRKRHLSTETLRRVCEPFQDHLKVKLHQGIRGIPPQKPSVVSVVELPNQKPEPRGVVNEPSFLEESLLRILFGFM